LAALTASVLVPVYVGYFKIEQNGLENGLIFVGFVAVMSTFIIWVHKANIKRLIQGVEPKIGAKP
jgi:glycerol-3-phosphate acyltransferase PlsY